MKKFILSLLIFFTLFPLFSFPLYTKEEVTFNKKWDNASFSKINDGVSYLYKNKGDNRRNITVCVNAGHGCKNGIKERTYSHPDKTPKLTGGTTAKGSVLSIAISDGMVFTSGKKESEINLIVALFLRDLLLEEGFDVLMIRESDNTNLDNIARTVMANNNADIHISIHFDGDYKKYDKGVFFCSIPHDLCYLANVKNHYENSQKLGTLLVKALENEGFSVYNNGKMDVDLTQTSYSTIPTCDIELGNNHSDISTPLLLKRAKALVEGIKSYFSN